MPEITDFNLDQRNGGWTAEYSDGTVKTGNLTSVAGDGNVVGVSTWANIPNAASYPVGAGWLVTNIPAIGAGTVFHSDGFRWCRYQPTLIAGSAAAAPPVTGSTAESTVVSFTLPAGLLGPNGTLDIETRWSVNNTANSKIVRHYLGASVMHSVSPASGTYIGLATSIANRNAQVSQIGNAVNLYGVAGAGNNTIATAAVDTSIDQIISIRAQLSVSTDAMTLESWRVLFTSRG